MWGAIVSFFLGIARALLGMKPQESQEAVQASNAAQSQVVAAEAVKSEALQEKVAEIEAQPSTPSATIIKLRQGDF